MIALPKIAPSFPKVPSILQAVSQAGSPDPSNLLYIPYPCLSLLSSTSSVLGGNAEVLWAGEERMVKMRGDQASLRKPQAQEAICKVPPDEGAS